MSASPAIWVRQITQFTLCSELPMLFKSAVTSGPAQSLQSRFSYFQPCTSLKCPQVCNPFFSISRWEGKGGSPVSQAPPGMAHSLTRASLQGPSPLGRERNHRKVGKWHPLSTYCVEAAHLQEHQSSLLPHLRFKRLHITPMSHSRDYTLLQLAQKDFVWNSSRYPGKISHKDQKLKKKIQTRSPECPDQMPECCSGRIV